MPDTLYFHVNRLILLHGYLNGVQGIKTQDLL